MPKHYLRDLFLTNCIIESDTKLQIIQKVCLQGCMHNLHKFAYPNTGIRHSYNFARLVLKFKLQQSTNIHTMIYRIKARQHDDMKH